MGKESIKEFHFESWLNDWVEKAEEIKNKLPIRLRF